MSVNVQIKPKSFLGKKLNMKDIIQITKMSYGYCDENYRLVQNEIGNHTLLFDETKLARGIDISFEGNNINLSLSLPTSPTEIRKFYEIIEIICKKIKVKEYIREGEKACPEDSETFMQWDEQGSITGLEDLQEKLEKNEYERFEIFGIYNPISIGTKEIQEIGTSLENLETFLHRLQASDVYYATPRVYKIQERLVGIYAIGPNIPSVVPTEPYIVLNQIQGIEEWYVILEGKMVKYEDFFKNISTQEYYDANHIIATLNEDEIKTLIEQYEVQL